MLDVVEAIVARVDSPRLGTPGLGPRIRRVDGDIHDLRDLHAPLADHRPLRTDHAVASAVEGPRAAEGAVPRATARELDRRTGIERAEKVPAPMAEQVARRHEHVQALDQPRGRSFAI